MIRPGSLLASAMLFTTLGCGASSSMAPASPTNAVGTVHSQGTLSIPQTFAAELDAGSVPTTDPSPSVTASDVWFDAETPTDRRLSGFGGAALQPQVLSSRPGFDGCYAALRGTATSANAPVFAINGEINIDALAVGSYLCAKTNQGRYAEIRVEALPGPSPASTNPVQFPALTITFTTYDAR